MRYYSWILFFILLFLEGTVTSFPFVLIFLLCLMVMKRAEWVFLLALVSGILLDALAVRPLGTTSILLLLFVFLTLLYERKYEIATIPFVFSAGLFGSFFYLFLLHYPSILESVLSGFVAVIAFIIYHTVHRPSLPRHLDYQKV